MWKDFREFWKSQVFWALMISLIPLGYQWKWGLLSIARVRENLPETLAPYAGIVVLFLLMNVSRTLFVTERDALRKRRRLQKREELRAERQAERERNKPLVYAPNLQFRRVYQNRMWIGHEISGHAYTAGLLEIGNELSNERTVGSADEVRAHLTYFNSAKENLQTKCPGFWSTHERETRIRTGESKTLAVAILHSGWFTDLIEGVPLKGRVEIHVRLLDKMGKLLTDPIYIESRFDNTDATFKRIQAAS